MSDIAQFVQALEDISQRRLRRVRLAVSTATVLFDGELESTAIAGAIPLLYAHWEGYVRETIQLYLDFIERSEVRFRDLDYSTLAFAWESELKKLSGGHHHSKAIAFLEFGAGSWSQPAKFGNVEKAVDLKSNANSKVLSELAEKLCINVQHMAHMASDMDDFIDVRNRIGHGREYRIDRRALFQYNGLTRQLILTLESALVGAASARSFCR